MQASTAGCSPAPPAPKPRTRAGDCCWVRSWSCRIRLSSFPQQPSARAPKQLGFCWFYLYFLFFLFFFPHFTWVSKEKRRQLWVSSPPSAFMGQGRLPGGQPRVWGSAPSAVPQHHPASVCLHPASPARSPHPSTPTLHPMCAACTPQPVHAVQQTFPSRAPSQSLQRAPWGQRDGRNPGGDCPPPRSTCPLYHSATVTGFTSEAEPGWGGRPKTCLHLRPPPASCLSAQKTPMEGK